MGKVVRFLFLSSVLAIISFNADAQTSLMVTDGAAVLDGVITPGEYTSQTMVTNQGVSLQAMGDGEFLYLVAQWADATESINKAMWTYDGAAWTKSGNEDRIAFIWDLGLNGSDGVNCTTMCHGGTLMGTSTGMVDVWHWKAARGGTTNGVTDDKWWFTEDDGRHSDSGTSAYSDNVLVDGHPTSMPQGGPGTAATFLAKDQSAFDLMTPIATHPVALAVPFDVSAAWANGDTVPGYVLRVPAGDRANVQSMASYDNGTWTVEFKRPYAGSNTDFTVIPGSSIDFSHEIFDNTGGGHTNDGYDEKIYTLDFSALAAQMVTTLQVATGAATLDGLLSDGEWASKAMVTHTTGVSMYSMADGNHLYVAAQWVDQSGTESLNKSMWTYDGAAWTKSGNEDRFALIWDMGLNGTDGANCGTMCHGTTMGTSTGIVDVWHWKAARGGTALGFADDKYWNTDLDGRHSDAGTSAYSDNVLVDGHPEFMQMGGPMMPAVFLANDQPALDIMAPMTMHASALAMPFDQGAAWTNGDTVPGYVLRVPSGDRASVESASSFNKGVWTVEFKKPYAGGEHDFAVVAGSTVNFSQEIFDNTGGGHPNDGYDSHVYTLDFATIITGVEQILTDGIPSSYELEQNYPNPFNPSTTIQFTVVEPQDISLSVYDPLGRLVQTLVDERMTPGLYQVDFSGTDLASGVYFYELRARDNVQTRKMILLK